MKQQIVGHVAYDFINQYPCFIALPRAEIDWQAINKYKEITATRASTRAIDYVHANSKLSQKSQHLYEIYNIKSGDVVKVGISSTGKRRDGKSIRAEYQVRKFNREEGDETIYASRIILDGIPNRNTALILEVILTSIRHAQGHSLKKHFLPYPIIF